ncbi:MAG: hypothetical protein ACR2N2_01105 [Acidimicrobiia bacterium]
MTRGLVENTSITPTVFLIGGSPGAGKTTLGVALARRIGCPSLTIDDLRTGMLGISDPTEYPELHVIGRPDAITYFTTTSPDQMIEDADAQHTALWPAVRAIIRKRAHNREALVIDGWHLMPELVAADTDNGVHASWLDVDHDVLAERERDVWDFYAQSSDPDAMYRNFLARSVRWNDRTATAARRFGFHVMRQDGTASASDLVAEILLDASQR